MAAVLTVLVAIFLGLISSNSAQDPKIKHAAPKYEPYVNTPAGLEQERAQLMYPFELKDFQRDITVIRPLHDAPLPCRLPFFGFTYHYLLVHKDGYITFNRGLLSYDFPITFPIQVPPDSREEDPSILAPWLSQHDIPRNVDGAGVYFRIIEVEKERNITMKERIYRDFREGMIGAADFHPKCLVIATWKNISFANPQSSRPLRTNTFQAVIATDELRTYAMFNYEWIHWVTHMDNFDGLNGPQAFIGFNAGNMTRAYEFRPYSQRPHINTLPERGFGNGLKGRYYFQIDEEIWFGSCLERELDPNWNERPLTFFPRYGHMLGGTMVNITGPCLGTRKRLVVKFDFINVECIVHDDNHATCISPALMYHGYIDIATGLDEKSFFYHGKFYIQPPEITEEKLKVIGNDDRSENPSQIELAWVRTDLDWRKNPTVQLHLWGYRETDAYPELTYITTLTKSGIDISEDFYKLDVRQFEGNDDSSKTDLTFGFISMNLTNNVVFGDRGERQIMSPVLWSRPMPLAWYFKPQWDRLYGADKWKPKYCDTWYQRELNADRFAHTNFRCPCTKAKSDLDRGAFNQDVLCNVINHNCEPFHKGAHHCVMSGRPAVGGAGQMCCYDDHGELLQTADSMFGGRPSRAFKYGKHPYKQKMMIPTLSNWLHDVTPFFFCCLWSSETENSDTCAQFKFWRTSQDCSSYISPGVGSVFGDPHIMTFDRTNYTFNGRGEFVLVRAHDEVHKLDVQARFEQVPKNHWLDPSINATEMTSVAARDNQSSIVEFRLRPVAARWRYHLYVIVDHEYIFFWDDSLRIQHFKGLTLYQPAGTWNMSHIVAMFDSGAGVEVLSGNGRMAVNVLLPITFINRTRGLLGYWSGLTEDDFQDPEKAIAVSPGASQRSIHNSFGNKWRLSETEQKNVGRSLFHHNSVPFSMYDDTNFPADFGETFWVPHLTVNASFPFTQQDVLQACTNSKACQFDFMLTHNREFARMTAVQEAEADRLAEAVREPEVRCHALPKPQHGGKSENRYFVGSIVRFTCDPGYRLSGTEVRKCRNNGLWTWGFDAECISDTSYRASISGLAVGILIPIIICGFFIGICFVRIRRRSDNHYTGEKGLPPGRAIIEIRPTDAKVGVPESQKLTDETTA